MIPVAIVLGGAVVALIWVNSGNGQEAREIQLSGNIELTEVNIAFQIPGRMVHLAVDEGDDVKAGTAVASLDSEELLNRRGVAAAALQETRANVQQLRTAIRFERENVRGQIDQRNAELEQFQANLKRLLAGSRQQEIEEARARVQRLQAEKENARKDWERFDYLFKKDAVSASQHDQARTRLDAATATLREAEHQLSLIEEGPRKEDIEAARHQVQRARAGLSLAEAGKLELKRKEQELQTRLAEVDRAQAELEVIKSQLGYSVARAPIDGVVLVKSAEEGEVLAAGSTVLTLGDIEHPWLRGYISEHQLGLVHLGDRAVITSDSFPGKEFQGRVSFISSEAEFTPKQIQTREERVKLVYRVKIDVENPRRELKLNMPVDARILLNSVRTQEKG